MSGTQTEFVFVSPHGRERVSGGNLYNQGLIDALAAIHAVRSIRSEEWDSLPATKGVYLVDTLNLDDFGRIFKRRVTGQRFVLLVHHLASLEPGLEKSDPRVVRERELLRNVDAFIVSSHYTETVMRSFGYLQAILVIEPPIAKTNQRIREFQFPVRALMVCNLIPRKGVLELLIALANQRCGVDFQIQIVGRNDLDSSYSAACASAMASENLSERVSYLGTISHSEMYQWYAGANLFLSASRMETYGIALQEARFAGLPILAVAGGNTSAHLRQGVTGELFSSPSEMAKAVVEHIRSPAQLVRYFDAAQQRRPLTHGSWVEQAERVVEAFQGWLSGR